tara:strand:+ start:82 stop:642 length:561 start_codon:yes stop_codon:yes gene_type:complete
MRSIIFLIFYITTHFACSSLLAAEEVKFDKISSNEIYEIRKYSDRLVVEAVWTKQGNSFRKLFKYISGNNKINQKIKMTTPVTRMKKAGNITMQFYLPSKFVKNNVPKPSNSELKIITIEGGYYAVIRFSGRYLDKNFIKHQEILKKSLNKNKILILGSPIKATFNRPYTLPLLRRNEVMFKIDWK